MPRQEDGYVYDPLDRRTYEIIAYNAVGRGSEINTLPAYKLTHSTGQSGWSVGLMQWDMGQRGRQHVVPDLMAGYQAWAPENARFTDAEVRSLTTRLQTPGQQGNALTAIEQDRLNQFLRSDPGREFVNNLDRQQIAYKWDNVGQPLSEIPWLQDLRRTDPAEAAEIVAMASKRFNQGETRGRELIRHLEQNEMTSTELRDWIDTVSARPPANREALLTGRDNALTAVRLVNDLELGDGRLARAWREELHTNGNTGLTQGFSANPEVQLFDAMMRNPVSGRRILSAIDDDARGQATVISGANAAAQLEMSRVELSRQGTLTVRSPDGVNFEMTAEGWNRNGVPMRLDPNPVRADADHLDHMDRGRAPRMPQGDRHEALPRPPAGDDRGGQPGMPPGRDGPEMRDGPDGGHELHAPPGRRGVQQLDDARHENFGMYTSLLALAHDRDDKIGRVRDDVSKQLAGGLTEVARGRELTTIGFAQFSPDGSKVYMTDTQDPSAPWARTAVADVGQLVGQPLAQSSENVAKINERLTLEQDVQAQAQAQVLPSPDSPLQRGARLL